jgi:hypothetical protein
VFRGIQIDQVFLPLVGPPSPFGGINGAQGVRRGVHFPGTGNRRNQKNFFFLLLLLLSTEPHGQKRNCEKNAISLRRKKRNLFSTIFQTVATPNETTMIESDEFFFSTLHRSPFFPGFEVAFSLFFFPSATVAGDAPSMLLRRNNRIWPRPPLTARPMANERTAPREVR